MADSGLYVHVPFCASKCPYCAFASCTRSGHLAPAWRDAVLAEADRRAGRFGTFDTLYLGGGTPGLLADDLLAGLVTGLRRALPFAADVESTIEANPADVTPARAIAWRAMGLNRVSLGVQSFDDDDLRFLGRRHDASQAAAALVALRDAGFANVGVDLIYGLPGQALATWRDTLDRALSFGPAHLSCYGLTVEPRTPLARSVHAGRIVMPDESRFEAFFLETSRRLAASGFVHYEVSNFAHGLLFASRHNGKYWHHVPYLGLGPSAHSFDGARRWWNVRGVEPWLRRLGQGRLPTAATERPTAEQRRLETLALGFRTSSGVVLSILRATPGWQAILDAQVADGRLEVADGRAVPTVRGLLVADALARAFA